MGLAYEVTYRNMFPSDDVNARIRENFGALQKSFNGAKACSAWLTQSAHALSLRIEVRRGRTAHEVKRFAAGPADLAAEIDAAFMELHRGFEGRALAA